MEAGGRTGSGLAIQVSAITTVAIAATMLAANDRTAGHGLMLVWLTYVSLGGAIALACTRRWVLPALSLHATALPWCMVATRKFQLDFVQVPYPVAPATIHIPESYIIGGAVAAAFGITLIALRPRWAAPPIVSAGLLAFALWSAMEPRRDQTRATLQEMGRASRLYVQTNGRHPMPEDCERRSLYHHLPARLDRSLVTPQGEVLDGWNRPLRFRWADHKDVLLLYSLGRDGVESGDDLVESLNPYP